MLTYPRKWACPFDVKASLPGSWDNSTQEEVDLRPHITSDLNLDPNISANLKPSQSISGDSRQMVGRLNRHILKCITMIVIILYRTSCFILCVVGCVHMCLCMCLCVNMQNPGENAGNPPLSHYTFFFFLRQALSLNLQFAASAGLAGQWALGIHLSPPPALGLRTYAAILSFRVMLGSWPRVLLFPQQTSQPETPFLRMLGILHHQIPWGNHKPFLSLFVMTYLWCTWMNQAWAVCQGLWGPVRLGPVWRSPLSSQYQTCFPQLTK